MSSEMKKACTVEFLTWRQSLRGNLSLLELTGNRATLIY